MEGHGSPKSIFLGEKAKGAEQKKEKEEKRRRRAEKKDTKTEADLEDGHPEEQE